MGFSAGTDQGEKFIMEYTKGPALQLKIFRNITMRFDNFSAGGLCKQSPPYFLPLRRPPHRGVFENCGSSLAQRGGVLNQIFEQKNLTKK
jgi:hypothetical protein